MHMYTYMFKYMCMYMYVYMNMYMYVYMYNCMYMSISISISVSISVSICTCAHTHIHIHIHVYTYTYTHTHTHIHTYTQTHRHAHMYTLQKSIFISTLHRRTGSGADRVQNGSIKPRLCRASSACMDSRLVTGLAVLARSHWQPRRCKHSERFPVATCTPSTLLQVRGCCWDWSRWVRRLSCIYTHLGWFCGGMYSRRSPSSSMLSFFETSWHADACVCHPQPCNAGREAQRGR